MTTPSIDWKTLFHMNTTPFLQATTAVGGGSTPEDNRENRIVELVKVFTALLLSDH